MLIQKPQYNTSVNVKKGRLTSPCWQKTNMLSGWREKWWQSMNHSQLGSQQGIPSLLFPRRLTLPRGDTELSEHIVSALMWPCHWLQSHHHPSAAQHSFVPSSSHLNCCKSKQRAVSAKHTTGPPSQGLRTRGKCKRKLLSGQVTSSLFSEQQISFTLTTGGKQERSTLEDSRKKSARPPTPLQISVPVPSSYRWSVQIKACQLVSDRIQKTWMNEENEFSVRDIHIFFLTTLKLHWIRAL